MYLSGNVWYLYCMNIGVAEKRGNYHGRKSVPYQRLPIGVIGGCSRVVGLECT